MLLDTSGLVCYLDRADPRHAEARSLFRSAPARITHSYVLAELVPLCRARRSDPMRALALMDDLLANPHVEMVWVEESLHRAGMALLRERPDKLYSLCDAVSFVLMRGRVIAEALTTDHHFEQEGFVRLLPQ